LKRIQRSHIVDTEPFQQTFGPKAQRKKPRLDVGTFEELSKASSAIADEAEEKKDEASTETGGKLKYFPAHTCVYCAV
jgi:nuclear GTP-binding protein